jgi:thiamine-monophosphate kinase
MGADERIQGTARSTSPTRVADIGEFGLIERLAALVGPDRRTSAGSPGEGEIGIGDDAALWRPTPDRWEVLTTDALVEDVHFKLTTTGWRNLGWKALAENVSDVAAMGAQPRRAFVTLGLRPDTAVEDLEDLYRGMRDLASEFDVSIVGGDTVSSPVFLISVSVVGELAGPGLRRSVGRPGDLLAVTGELGGSGGGLLLLEGGVLMPTDEDERALVERHRRPRPRVREGLLLAEAGVRCGMDLSDGLLGDAAKLAAASGVGVMIREPDVPIERALDRRFGERARALAVTGGEDYELLVAGPRATLERAAARLAAADLARLTIVGRLTAEGVGRVRLVDVGGREVPSPRPSWDHFSSASGAA